MTRDKPATKISDPVLTADIQHFPDDYQWERAKRLGVSQSAIHYALKRLRISRKKTIRASPDSQHRLVVFLLAHH
ncbi:IS630 transposase-related protein [Xenorhabdus khoisanae]|nr:IS630 transposase-related protein [Xenorhabdus khoisanae]MDC9613921.1 IS630 transposase-related protein [Xenorhabdus khoisanae]